MSRLRARRGSALILVLLMTLAVAALAVAAIFMSGSASLLSRFYDRERLFAYAAQSGIDRVVSRLQLDSTFTVETTTPVLALDQTQLMDATGAAITGATIRVWAARTGDTTSTGPVTISLLAQVSDVSGTRFARRVDVRRLHFGQWALIANTGNQSGEDPFPSTSVVAGRVHANDDWETITQVSYRDSVTSVGTFGTTNAANIRTGRGEGVRRIPWPADTAVLNPLRAAATADSLFFDVSSSAPARAELVWVDLNSNQLAERTEGFIRIFELEHSDSSRYLETRPASFNSGNNEGVEWTDHVVQNQCGAFYRRNGTWQFFPVSVHRAPWAWAIIDSAFVSTPRPAGGNAYSSAATRAILSLSTARCFPAGSPYLVNVERFTNASGQVGVGPSHNMPFGAATTPKYGGQDTTITLEARSCNVATSGPNIGVRCSGQTWPRGRWRTLSATAGRETLRALDDGASGAVVFFDDDIRLSGSVAGRVTVATDGWMRLVDHVTSADSPNVEAGACNHLLGLVADDYVRVEEGMITHRVRVGNNPPAPSWVTVTLSGGDHFPLHAAVLSLESYFGVEGQDFRQGNSNTSACEGSNVSMGCIRHVGSAAMHETRAFSTGNNANGARYVLTPDACMETVGFRPPLFPATNRYRVLRSVDVRPASIIGVNAIANYFATLQGTSDIP